MLFPFTVAASNPVVTSIFTADPATLVYNDRLYLYTGHDEAAVGGWFNMKDWHIFSTKDMVTWTDHGACLTLNKFSWASGDAWASQCVYRNNKFYWYVSTLHKTKGGHAVGVAVSDSPTGPFTDPRGTAMITTDMTPGTSTMDDIDPTVFVDDDGQAYMYWGNGTCKYVKLKDDMITVDGSVNNVTLQGFGEAPWLHKRNGIYYLSYSSSLPSTIVYCTSSKPTGPWTYKGRILQPVKNCGTSHQAIQQFRDQWYMIYHNGILPTGGDTRRSVCVDYLYYNTDGTIKEVVQTTTGVNASNPVAVNSLHEKISNTTGMIIRTHTNGCTFNVPVKQATLMIYALNGDIISKLSSSDNQIFWNGHTSDGVKVPNGNYVAKLFSPSYTATKQLILAH
jgi:hypothetical protein